MTTANSSKINPSLRWRWLSGAEGERAVAQTSFEAGIQSQDIRRIDGLAADVRGPWAEALLSGKTPGSPAIAASFAVFRQPDSIFKKGADGQFLLDGNGNTILSDPIKTQRLRVISALLDQETNMVFALGFSFKEPKLAGAGGRSQRDGSESEERAQQRETAAWMAMNHVFSGPKNGELNFLSFRLGRLGEKLSAPRGQEKNEQAVEALAALCDAMGKSGFAAFWAQTEAAAIAASLPQSAPSKPRAPGRI